MIEWADTGLTSSMKHVVHDNSGHPPTNILRAGAPYSVTVDWDIPPTLVPFINPSDTFRIRIFSESLGPGPDEQVGMTVVVPAVANQRSYTQKIDVTSNTLPGEGAIFNGKVVSGMYKFFCVLQHLSSGGPTKAAGCSDLEPTVLFNLP